MFNPRPSRRAAAAPPNPLVHRLRAAAAQAEDALVRQWASAQLRGECAARRDRPDAGRKGGLER
jgi:hypothetical protein